jgi:hypothetical protein
MNEKKALRKQLTDSRQIASIRKDNGTEAKLDVSPRVYSLHKYVFYVFCVIIVGLFLTVTQKFLSDAHRPATQY